MSSEASGSLNTNSSNSNSANSAPVPNLAASFSSDRKLQFRMRAQESKMRLRHELSMNP